jgi:hypothetical protein
MAGKTAALNIYCIDSQCSMTAAGLSPVCFVRLIDHIQTDLASNVGSSTTTVGTVTHIGLLPAFTKKNGIRFVARGRHGIERHRRMSLTPLDKDSTTDLTMSGALTDTLARHKATSAC